MEAENSTLDQLKDFATELVGGTKPKRKRMTKSYKTELKKAQIRERRILILALLGWSLALIQMAIFIVRFQV